MSSSCNETTQPIVFSHPLGKCAPTCTPSIYPSMYRALHLDSMGPLDHSNLASQHCRWPSGQHHVLEHLAIFNMSCARTKIPGTWQEPSTCKYFLRLRHAFPKVSVPTGSSSGFGKPLDTLKSVFDTLLCNRLHGAASSLPVPHRGACLLPGLHQIPVYQQSHMQPSSD